MRTHFCYMWITVDVENHADQALLSAVKQILELTKLNQELAKESLPLIKIGIGINTGLAVVGEMGSIGRSDYTCIGDPVNLASQAAVALNNAQLVDDLEQLLESFLNSIIYTIGRKSPYTAGHINRMVDLSEMLSHKINQYQTIFSEINYTEEQLQQIKLAALMHDIGKLATPEVVMDKATKLDGHFDRIELVEMRANYIRTLLEKQLLLSPKNSQPDLVVALERLTKAVELIKNTNLGGEFLPDEQVAEINQLAQIPFVIGAQSEFLLTEDEAYNLIYILDIKKASKN